VPDFVEVEVQRLMAKHPQDRPASAEKARDLLDQLRRHVVGEPTRLASAAVSSVSVGGADRVARPPHDEVDESIEDDTGSSSTIARSETARPTADFASPEKSRRPLIGVLLMALVLTVGGGSLLAANWCEITGGDECARSELPGDGLEEPPVAILAPAAPEDVSVVITDDGYGVSWSAVDGATKYRVEQMADGTPYSEVGTSIVVPTEEPVLNWCFRVFAIGEGGKRSVSSEQGCSG